MASTRSSSNSYNDGDAISKSPAQKVESGQSKDGGDVEAADDRSVTMENEPPASGWSSWTSRARRFLKRHPIIVHLLIGSIMTAWWIYGLVLHRQDNWLVPFLVWLGIIIRLLTWNVSFPKVRLPQSVTSSISGPFSKVSRRWRLAAGTLVTVTAIILATFIPADSPRGTRGERALSGLGFLVILIGLTVTSRNFRMINWQAVIVGVLAQFLLGLLVLKSSVGFDIFKFIADMAIKLLGYSAVGVTFLTDPSVAKLPWFLIGVAPPIIFFVAFVQLLSHWGATQWLVAKSAVFFFRAMRVSGAEAVVAAASPFLGQGESALLVRPYLPLLTAAEMHQIQASGFSTVAGSVFYAYVSMGIDGTAILSSCIMSIPASLVVSKLRYPETDEPLTAGKLEIPEMHEDDKAANALDAFSKGAWLGLKLAGMIIAGLLCVLSLLALVNGLLGWWGQYVNITEPVLSVQLIVGYLFFPVASLLGVQKDNIFPIAQLIGTKVVANEFVAYAAMLQEPAFANLTERSKLVATYALCGFGNLGALGIQIGIMSQLAPQSSRRVTEVAVSALLTGIMATLTSACVAGMLA